MLFTGDPVTAVTEYEQALRPRSNLNLIVNSVLFKGRVFPSLQPDEFDRSVPNALMFLVDFGFYKFGFEVSVVLFKYSLLSCLFPEPAKSFVRLGGL